jgi:Zn-dependent protease with chaperone function
LQRYTKTEDGLAAVMGHEMAHAIARHGSQRLLRTSLAQTALMGASIEDIRQFLPKATAEYEKAKAR